MSEPSIYRPEFIPFYLGVKKKYSLTDVETQLYGFIRFYTSFDNRAFFFNNAHLAEILEVSERTVTRGFTALEEKGLIDLEYEIKTGGGKTRKAKVKDTGVCSDSTPVSSQTRHECLQNTYNHNICNSTTNSSETKTSEKPSPEINVDSDIPKTSAPSTGKKPSQFGNSDINDLIEHFKAVFELPILDDSVQANRRYCYLLIKKFKSVDKCKDLINIARRDKFWGTKIASFRTLYYKAVTIISLTREQKFSVTKV